MIKKVLLFGAGVATGVISVPVALVYIKPVQKVLAKSFAEFASEKLDKDSKLRQEAIEHCEKFAKLLKEHPDDKP